MEKTKENQRARRGRHKAKSTIGDKIFRVLVLIAIFIICLLFYVFYIKTMPTRISNDGNGVTTQIQKYN